MDLFLFISVIVGLTFIFLYFVIRYDFKKKTLEVEEKKIDLEKRKLEIKEEHQEDEE